MLDNITGQILSIQEGVAVVKTGGFGWKVLTTTHTAASLRVKAEVILKTHLVVNDHAFVLFGFADDAERDLFRRLIQVNGVGPQSALLLLSGFRPDDFAAAILHEDLDALTSVKGIGKKTAQRLLIELKETMAEHHFSGATPSRMASQEQKELCRLLEGLGFNSHDAKNAGAGALKQLGPDATIEAMLQFALQPKP